MAESEIYSPGLEGVIAGDTAISTVIDGLRYRGYAVTELAEKTTFDVVAYLLLHEELPTARQMAEFQKRVAGARRLPDPLRRLFQELPPAAPPIDVLRSSVSILAHFDPDMADLSRDANLRKAERLLGQIPLAIATHHRIRKGLAPIPPRPDLGHAANFLYMLCGQEPSAAATRALDVSLILYAEHEFNASTFAARVVCSTESDLHSGIVAAIGALKGRLHGGANEKVMELLEKTGGPSNAEKWVREALAQGTHHGLRSSRVQGRRRARRHSEAVCAPGGRNRRLAAMGGDGRDHRARRGGRETPVPQPRLARWPALPRAGAGNPAVYADLRHVARDGLERALHRAGGA